jgi:hypothetical protein
MPGVDAVVPPLVAELVTRKVGFPVEFHMVGGVVDRERLNTLEAMMAANQLPDVFNDHGHMIPEFLRQAATTFPLADLTEHMPRMYEFLDGLMDQLQLDHDATWALYEKPDTGYLWGVPRTWVGGWVPSGQMWREDILEELGYQVPRTLAEAEEVFEAYKAVYDDAYPVSGRGKAGWQCFELVFNAYGFSAAWPVIRDDKITQSFATREFREAIQVLRLWYQLGYWSPDFINQGTELFERFAAGDYLVLPWIGSTDWDFNTGKSTRWLDDLRSVPGARAGAYTHLAADENTKPARGVWHPFLREVTVFRKHLENDQGKLHRIMQVGDIRAHDREVKLLSGHGIDGVHYTIPEGETAPEPTTLVSSISAVERMSTYGFGFCWQGNFSSDGWINNRLQNVIDTYVLDADGPYHPSKLTWLLLPPLLPPITDLNGEPVRVSMETNWFDLVVDIMTGDRAIEDYDEWLETYYHSGGRDWEEHAARLWLPMLGS